MQMNSVSIGFTCVHAIKELNITEIHSLHFHFSLSRDFLRDKLLNLTYFIIFFTTSDVIEICFTHTEE